ncbi:MAG: AAA family ATPase [Cyanobacteriota bacterium]|nr:AAA family ATPase [Cyanobacteriota bacterium]
MKVESISIQNFKLFENLEVSFKNQTLDEVSNRFLILGDNGTGKTTLLQAIALPLALATRQISRVTEFDWKGFIPGRYWRWGPPHIELDISFEEEEIEATHAIFKRWHDGSDRDNSLTEPGSSKLVRLTLDGEKCLAGTGPEKFQFLGRYYAKELLKTDPSIRSEFSKLPGIFWFDQWRNLGSHPQKNPTNKEIIENSSRVLFELGVAGLRKYLNGWKFAQLTKNYSVDYLTELEKLYQQVFPTRKFAGVEPMPGTDSPSPEDYYFLLTDGNRSYDIEEMSAGEQSIFPILYAFVREQIANSVVLIDEIDLNLHPPAAQSLVNKLPKISQSCQFIFTTHSRSVNDIMGEAETYRLSGGSICL